MKTLKILIALYIMLGFATNAVNAQAQTFKETLTVTWGFPCMDESATGEITHHSMWKNDNFTLIVQGKLIGESGSVYSFIDIHTHRENWTPNNFQTVIIYNHKILVHKDGKPIALFTVVFYVTKNANGEVTTFRDEYSDWQCL
jgi:hypothetical protein